MFFRFQTLALKFRVTQTVVHPDSGILFSANKKQANKPWKDVEET